MSYISFDYCRIYFDGCRGIFRIRAVFFCGWRCILESYLPTVGNVFVDGWRRFLVKGRFAPYISIIHVHFDVCRRIFRLLSHLSTVSIYFGYCRTFGLLRYIFTMAVLSYISTTVVSLTIVLSLAFWRIFRILSYLSAIVVYFDY